MVKSYDLSKHLLNGKTFLSNMHYKPKDMLTSARGATCENRNIDESQAEHATEVCLAAPQVQSLCHVCRIHSDLIGVLLMTVHHSTGMKPEAYTHQRDKGGVTETEMGATMSNWRDNMVCELVPILEQSNRMKERQVWLTR